MCRAVVWVLALCAGCDHVFPIDPPPTLVRGTIRQDYATNNAMFEPVVQSRNFEVGEIAFAVTLADGSISDVDYQADGSFTFERATPEQSYRLTYSFGGRTQVLEHASAGLDLVSRVAGRPDRIPIERSWLVFPFRMNPDAAITALVATTGQWSHTGTGVFGPSVTFDWRTAAPVGNVPLGMLDEGRHDVAHAIETEFATLTPQITYQRIRAFSSTPVTLRAQQSSELSPLVDVAPDACMRATIPHRTVHERLVAAQPSRSYTDAAGTRAFWNVLAVPSAARLATAGEIWIAYSDMATVDTELAAPFHDAFTNHDLLANASSQAVFEVALPGTTAARISNISVRSDVLDPGTATCDGATVTLPSTVGLVTTATLGGTALGADGMSVALDLTRDIEVSWDVTTGPVHITTVAVHELSASSGITAVRALFSIDSTTRSVWLDRAWLEPGRAYAIAFTTHADFPGAASGDFETMTLPLETATTWSSWFYVQAL